MNLLVTGGAGFIGSSYVRLVRRKPPDGSGRQRRRADLRGQPREPARPRERPGHVFVRADIRDADAMRELLSATHRGGGQLRRREPRRPQHPVGGAVPGHQRAGTLRLLEAARAAGVRRFVQVSTDEVYGSLGPTGAFEETTPLSPAQPLLGQQGRRRPLRDGVPSHARHGRRSSPAARTTTGPTSSRRS